MEPLREAGPRRAPGPMSRGTSPDDRADEEIAAQIMGDRISDPPRGTLLERLKSPWIQLSGAVLLALGVLFGFGPGSQGSGDETGHANWDKHVVELNAIYDRTGNPLLKQVLADGTTALTGSLELADEDNDKGTTDQVRNVLVRGTPADLAKAVQAAQQIPQIEDPEIQLTPTISTGMQNAVLTGDAKFYHLFLFDACGEDGDIVDVYINGEIFARVPITNAGATLSIPVGTGTSVDIVGFRDGVGGITVACRSSQGEFFARVLNPGEVQPLGVVR